MKKKPLHKILSLGLCILFSQLLSAQANCYSTYKSKGDKYKNDRNYDLAAKQYQYAKNCKYLTNSQRIEIDKLIDDVNKKKSETKKEAKVKRKVR